MFQIRICRENKSIFLCSIHFLLKIMPFRENVGKYGAAREAIDDNVTRRMRLACWITKVTDTYSNYLIVTAFARQQWLRERALVLSYTYIASLV
jgi:hypothetical protein